MYDKNFFSFFDGRNTTCEALCVFLAKKSTIVSTHLVCDKYSSQQLFTNSETRHMEPHVLALGSQKSLYAQRLFGCLGGSGSSGVRYSKETFMGA